MNRILKFILTISFVSLTSYLYAQKSAKKDTVYYLVDTAKVPVNDRMLLVGQEGNFYGYRIMCECNPYHEDPYFIRHISKKGIVINRKQLETTKWITLRQLIHLTVQYGTNNTDQTVFYFIEPDHDKFIKHEVHLVIGAPPQHGY